MAESRTFVARHARYKVPCCNAPIVEGDLVRYTDDDDLVHADHDNLHAHLPTEKPDVICPTCSLAKPCWCE